MIKLMKKKASKKRAVIIEETDSDVVKLGKLVASFEKMKLGEYIQYLGKPWRIVWTNILVGVSRGIGLTLGMAIVIILIIKLLGLFISLNVFPWLSETSQDLLYIIRTTPGLEKIVEVVDRLHERQQLREAGVDVPENAPTDEVIVKIPAAQK